MKAKVSDFIQDDRNLNKGTARGKVLMDKSLSQFGAGRSILVDKNGRIIAGNKTQLAALKAGIVDAEVVETTGDKLVVVKRIDVELDSKKGRELAYADNKTTEIDLDWDNDEMKGLADDFGVDFKEWDCTFGEEENQDSANKEHKDLSNEVGSLFQIAIDCADEYEQEQIYNELKDKYKCRVLTL